MIAYKVTMSTSKGEESINILVARLKVVYEVGRRRTAQIGGLLCFPTEELAWQFKQSLCNQHNFTVWKVEAKKEVTLPPYAIKSIYYSANLEKALSGLWEEGIAPELSHVYYCYWPKGTIAFKHVTLLEKL